MAPLVVTVVLLLTCLVSCSTTPLRIPMSEDVASACRCTREFNAVCANDGQTYSNECMLNCARATGTSRMGQSLKLMKLGAC